VSDTLGEGRTMKKTLDDLTYGDYYIYERDSDRVHQKINVALMGGKDHEFTLNCETGFVYEMRKNVEVIPLSYNEAVEIMQTKKIF
jgi:hypothetical protein